ncbi:hypothetical protein HDU76_004913 [Blyttiomyces sp. JEL0837]|nr:hypothetical protein HDU76_004913 [Blyttiomyces sp. JEL0837]
MDKLCQPDDLSPSVCGDLTGGSVLYLFEGKEAKVVLTEEEDTVGTRISNLSMRKNVTKERKSWGRMICDCGSRGRWAFSFQDAFDAYNLRSTSVAMRARGIVFLLSVNGQEIAVTDYHSTAPSPSSQNTLRSMALPTKAKMDSTALMQLLSNIQGNAMKFTPSGGCIRMLVNVMEEVGDVEDLTPLEECSVSNGSVVYVFGNDIRSSVFSTLR